MSVDWQVPLVEIDVSDEDVTAVLDCLRSVDGARWIETAHRREERRDEPLVEPEKGEHHGAHLSARPLPLRGR